MSRHGLATLAWGLGAVKFLLLLGLVACSSEYQEVRIVIDDFRFSPARVDVQAGQPVRLMVRNQGRETHRFQSPLFAQPRDRGRGGFRLSRSTHSSTEFPLASGQRLELVHDTAAGCLSLPVSHQRPSRDAGDDRGFVGAGLRMIRPRT